MWRRGVCAAFADPRLTAAQAHPVWLPRTRTRTLCLTGHAIDGPHGNAPGVLVAALPNVAHVLLDTLGRQHVILRSGAAYLQVVVSGRTGVMAPMVLGIHIEESEGISAAAKQLAKLKRFLSASPDMASARWTAQTLNLRDALIALDGDRAGATLPEIAAVIYGRERIERDWPGKGLRDRVRRTLQRGQALCDGGYRDLLR